MADANAASGLPAGAAEPVDQGAPAPQGGLSTTEFWDHLDRVHEQLGDLTAHVEGEAPGQGLLLERFVEERDGARTMVHRGATRQMVRDIAQASGGAAVTVSGGRRLRVRLAGKTDDVGTVGNAPAHGQAAGRAAAAAAGSSTGETRPGNPRAVIGLTGGPMGELPASDVIRDAATALEYLSGVHPAETTPLQPFDVEIVYDMSTENPLEAAALLGVMAGARALRDPIDASWREDSKPGDPPSATRRRIDTATPPLFGRSPNALVMSATSMASTLTRVGKRLEAQSTDITASGEMRTISRGETVMWIGALANLLVELALRVGQAVTRTPADNAVAAAARIQLAWMHACQGRLYVPLHNSVPTLAADIGHLAGKDADTGSTRVWEGGDNCPFVHAARSELGIKQSRTGGTKRAGSRGARGKAGQRHAQADRREAHAEAQPVYSFKRAAGSRAEKREGAAVGAQAAKRPKTDTDNSPPH